ncbi:Fic family protein [Candidatus Gottesmanbacteria bacterium]|nr:Fic family protein [Candidatus Gottesmanbacteria bacterium]
MYTPKYTITNKILKDIGTVEACREIITNAPLVPAWEARFREEAIIRTVHYGTHIEGNALNFTEAAKVISGQSIVARDRDIQEVINYRNVLRFIGEAREIGEAGGKVTEQALKHLHKLTVEKILPSEECGKYRQTQVVLRNSQTGEISFRPPASVAVPFLIEDFLEWLNSKAIRDMHPVLQAGITHYELVRIHPFVDGNGRVARAVATWVLFREGYDIKKFFSLEEHYDKDDTGYYKALQSVEKPIIESEHSGNGDLTYWLEYFTEGLAIELTRIKEKVQKLSVDLKIKEHLGGGQVALNERQMKILEYVQQTGFIQSQIFREMFREYSDDTILRDLRDLMEKGVLKKEGSTKSARYVLIK